MAEGSGSNRLRIDYFYDETIGNFQYGEVKGRLLKGPLCMSWVKF